MCFIVRVQSLTLSKLYLISLLTYVETVYAYLGHVQAPAVGNFVYTKNFHASTIEAKHLLLFELRVCKTKLGLSVFINDLVLGSKRGLVLTTCISKL